MGCRIIRRSEFLAAVNAQKSPENTGGRQAADLQLSAEHLANIARINGLLLHADPVFVALLTLRLPDYLAAPRRARAGRSRYRPEGPGSTA